MIDTSPIFQYNNLDFINVETLNKCEDIYSEDRNFYIIGKAALVQINVLNDIKVFCNEVNDFSCIQNNNGKCETCGKDKFYEVENANEITQNV